MSEDIEEYIKNSYKKGMTKDEIEYNLLVAGHDINQIHTYLSNIPDNKKENIGSGMNENKIGDYGSNTYIQNNHKENIPSNSNKKRLFFFGIIIVLLFAVIASAFIFLGNKETLDNSLNENQDVGKTVFKNTASTPTNSEVDEKGFLTYDEEIDGIKIKYPKDWIAVKHFPGSQFKSNGNMLLFMSPKTSSNKYRATFILTYVLRKGDERVTKIVGFDNTVHTSKYDLRSLDGYLQSFLENNLNTLPDFKLIKTEESTILSHNAKKITYNYKVGSTKLKGMEYIVFIDDGIYSLRYIGDVDDFKKHLENANKMVESFEIVQ